MNEKDKPWFSEVATEDLRAPVFSRGLSYRATATDAELADEYKRQRDQYRTLVLQAWALLAKRRPHLVATGLGFLECVDKAVPDNS